MKTITVTLECSFQNTKGSIQGFEHVDLVLKDTFINKTNYPPLGSSYKLVLNDAVSPNELFIDTEETSSDGLLWAIQILVNQQLKGKEGFLPVSKQIQFDVRGHGSFSLFFHQDEEGTGWQLISKVSKS